MSDDSGIPSTALNMQLDHDRKMRVMEQLHGLTLQGAKGLGALNGAAAAASLAFVQALAARQALGVFKPYAVAALVFFLTGALLAALAFFFQYAYLRQMLAETGRHSWWRRVYWAFLVMSTATAIAGGAVMVRGISCAL